MRHLRSKLFQRSLVLYLLALPTANALQMSCNLEITIAQGESSETKLMTLEVVPLDADFDQTQGTLSTTSCYGSFQEQIASQTAHLHYKIQGDEIKGKFNDSALNMGRYQYQVDFHFTQLVKDLPDQEKIDFAVKGKIVTINDPAFPYDQITGRCTLAQFQ